MSAFKYTLKLATIMNIVVVIVACGGGDNSATQINSTKPLIKIIGPAYITIPKNSVYKELGATAIDAQNNTLSVKSKDNITPTIVGTYTVSYIATDATGNSATAQRKVSVTEAKDNHAPSVSNLTIKGFVESGKILQLSYHYNDKEDDKEGESIIVWATQNTELQRGNNKSYLIPDDLDGEIIHATLYPVDNKHQKGKPIKASTHAVNAVSIKKYGAIGDGINDDSQAIKKAFANEAVVLIPKGIFLTTQIITIPKTLHSISGSGTIKGTHPRGILGMGRSGTNELRIEGITFRYEPMHDTIYASLYFNDAAIKNVSINNCQFISSDHAKWGNAILLVGKPDYAINNIKINNNTFTNITRASIEILVRGNNTTKSTEFPDWDAVNFIDSSVTDIEINNNKFSNQRIYQPTNEPIFNPAISLSGAVNGTLIDGNIIDGTYWGIELDGSVNQTISNNKINSKQNIFSITHGADPTGKTFIENNILSSPEHRILAKKARNITFRKNIITGMMYLWNTDNIVVEENKFYNHKQFTNIMLRTSKNSLIKNNYIENTFHTSRDGIRGYMGSDHSNIVTKNRIYVKSTGGISTSFTNGVATSDNNSTVTFKDNQSLALPEQ